MFTFARLQQLAILQLVILSVLPGGQHWLHFQATDTIPLPAITWPQDCSHLCTGLRDQPFTRESDPGLNLDTCLLLLTLTHLLPQPLYHETLLRKLQPPSLPDKLVLLLILKDQVWMSLESRKMGKEARWLIPPLCLYCIYFYSSIYSIVLFLAPDSLHISLGQGSVWFIPGSPEIMGSQWIFTGWVDGCMGQGVGGWKLDSEKGFPRRLSVSCLLLWVTRKSSWKGIVSKQQQLYVYKCDGKYEEFEGFKSYICPTPITLYTQLNHLGCFCLILIKEQEIHSPEAHIPPSPASDRHH